MSFPALLTPPTSNNTVQSPTAIQAKGDDYNRNPVGTGPFVVKSWTAGDRMVLERNPELLGQGTSPTSTASCCGRCPIRSRASPA